MNRETEICETTSQAKYHKFSVKRPYFSIVRKYDLPDMEDQKKTLCNFELLKRINRENYLISKLARNHIQAHGEMQTLIFGEDAASVIILVVLARYGHDLPSHNTLRGDTHHRAITPSAM